MTLEITNGGGAQTLDIKQPEWQDRGWAVVGDVNTPGSGPLSLSINTGTLGSGNGALSVASGDALVNGAAVSNSGATVDIATGHSEPRKDIIWIDSGGSINVEQGTPTVKQPPGATRFETFSPALPFPAMTPATVIGAVFVAANATAISAADLQDRRLSANTAHSAVSTELIESIGSSDGVTDVIHDIPMPSNAVKKAAQPTSAVSTSETVIYDGSAFDTTYLGNLTLVVGEDDVASSTTFTDLVLWTFDGGATRIGQSNNSSPATSSYSVPSSSQLGLTMGSGSYDVVAVGLSARY